MATATPAATPMSHRQIMEALSGLMLGMFVAILSSTIVSNALPTIVADLHATQTTYTWVITAALLANTVSTPIWGKLADLTSKKILVQLGLIVFVAGSAFAGLAQNPAMLIVARIVQGIGVGGLSALAQVIMAAMISPRERGRYSGYLGAVFALGTIGGPLIGGVIVDTTWLGWRWCFYAGMPFAVVALIVLQKTLHLPVRRREVKVDWLGATLISAAVSLILIWVSFAGDKYDWGSWQTGAMIGGAVVLVLLFILAETKAAEPIVPLHLFRNRTMSLATLASMLVGVAMFGATTFLSQYFQLARGETPTKAGLMTLPMIAGLAVSSTVVGRIITRTGSWKIFLVLGAGFLTVGFSLMGMLRHDTEYWQIAAFMFCAGVGVGMTMQNLVLSVQNQVRPEELGAASSAVTFFRTLGGAVGVSALGALLANRVAHYLASDLAAMGVHSTAGSGAIPKLSALPAPIRAAVEDAFGHATGNVFLYAAPCALLALLVILLIKEVPLRTVSAEQMRAAAPADPDGDMTGNATGDAAGNVETRILDLPPANRGHAYREETAPVSVGVAAANGHTPGQAPLQAPVPAPVRMPVHAQAPAAQPAYALAGNGAGDGDGGAIRGFVRSGAGTPVVHATLTLIDARGHQLGRATTRDDGWYLLPTPGSGTYVLIAAADQHEPQAATLAVGDQPIDFDLVLAGSGGLVGAVRDADGAPIEDAVVVVTDVRGEVVATGKTGADGDFAFMEVVAGTYTLAVSAAAHRPSALPVEVGQSGLTRRDVTLRAGTQVRGTIRAEGGGALADARVTLLDAAGNVVGVTTTGADGEYAFADLTGGQYTVIATGYPPVASALNLAGSGADAHDLWLGHAPESGGASR